MLYNMCIDISLRTAYKLRQSVTCYLPEAFYFSNVLISLPDTGLVLSA